MGFPGGSDGIESNCNVGDLGSIPALGRSPGEGKGYPLQYSGLENSIDREATARGVMKSQTRLSNYAQHSTWYSIIGMNQLFNLMVLEVWALNQPHEHHLETR